MCPASVGVWTVTEPALPVMTYLLWAPMGAEHVERFAEAYRAHPAGIDHELVIAACPGPLGAELEPVLAPLDGIARSVEVFEGPRIDLQTYRELIAMRPEAPEFVFGNSYIRPLADDWLRKLVEALREPGVGIAGPGGSYESLVRELSWPLSWIYAARHPGYPNPHIRTSCFAINRAGLAAARWGEVGSKAAAYRLEGGRKSLTRTIRRSGLEPVVVSRDGRTHRISDWRASHTFRSGDQRELLVADLRTDDYEHADPQTRAALERSAWGEREAAS